MKKNENWVSESKKEHRKIYSELDALLRSLDRFFYIENLPISQEDLTIKNFHDELVAVRDVIFRILGILEVIIPESKKSAYWFQKFTETKFLNDYTRDLFKEGMCKQDTPEKSLYLLYDAFINFKGIVTDLLRSENISYLSYKNIGQLVSKEIRENIYFNPFRMDINPEFDIIENPEISKIVRSIKDKEIKRYISVVYIYLFRFLRYLSHIEITSQYSVALNSALLILIMLRSEINMFHNYIKRASESIKEERLKNLLKFISYQVSMETKRVYLQELKDIMRKKAPQHFRGKIENSHGIMKNLVEQSIVQLVQYFKPEVQGKDLFESFTTRLHLSLKLREDIFVLHMFLTLLENKANSPEEIADVLKSLKNYMHYFESFTFKLLRYDDYDEFSAFFNDIISVKESGIQKILEKIHNFKIFLETTMQLIANRAEIADKPIDRERAEELFKKYL
jgi:hypothetical protein